MEWNQQKYSKTIPIDPNTNNFSFYTSSGIQNYINHVIQLETTNHLWQYEQCILCNEAENVHSDFNFDGFHEDKNIQQDTKESAPIELYDEAYESLSAQDINREFFRCHYGLGNLS